jgi:two-component system NtrC family sensor kinase
MDKSNILIISAQPDRLASLQATLASLGYDVFVAASAPEASAHVHRKKSALAFLHYSAPEDAQRLSRLRDEGVNLPVILLLPESVRRVPVEFLQSGLQGCLVLPVERAVLKQTIEAHLPDVRVSSSARLPREVIESSRRSADMLMILYSLGRTFTTILDIETLIDHILEATVHLIPADEVSLVIGDGQNKVPSSRMTRSLKGKVAQETRLRIEDSLADMVLQTGQPVLVNNLQDAAAKNGGRFVRSLLNMPLRIWDRSVGILSIVNKTTDKDFGEEDKMLLSVLADYAAVALENARMYSDSRQSAGMEMFRQTVATLSHHINNPLTALMTGIHTTLKQVESLDPQLQEPPNHPAVLQNLRVVEQKAEEIAAVISVLQEVVVPQSTRYWREEKMIDIEKHLKQRLQELTHSIKNRD